MAATARSGHAELLAQTASAAPITATLPTASLREQSQSDRTPGDSQACDADLRSCQSRPSHLGRSRHRSPGALAEPPRARAPPVEVANGGPDLTSSRSASEQIYFYGSNTPRRASQFRQSGVKVAPEHDPDPPCLSFGYVSPQRIMIGSKPAAPPLNQIAHRNRGRCRLHAMGTAFRPS